MRETRDRGRDERMRGEREGLRQTKGLRERGGIRGQRGMGGGWEGDGGGWGRLWYLVVWSVGLVWKVQLKQSVEDGEGIYKWNSWDSIPNRR